MLLRLSAGSLFLASLLLLAGLCRSKPSVDQSQQEHHRHRKHHGHPEHHAGWRRDDSNAQGSSAPRGAYPADNTTLHSWAMENCTSCFAREEAKLARIEKIKRDLLAKLGFKEEPRRLNASGAGLPDLSGGPIRDAIKRYGLQADDPGTPYDIGALAHQDAAAKTERVYVFAKPVPPEFGWARATEGRAYFSFSSDTRESEVTEAELNLYLRAPEGGETQPPTEIKLTLHRLTKKGAVEEMAFKTKKVEVNPRFGTWVKVSITSQTQAWFDKPEYNFGLHVEADYNGQNLVVFPDDNRPDKNMYVEMVTREGERAARRKRNAPPRDCQEGDRESRCCRYPLVIDFEQMGWDWVIAPKKYMAYYCNGGCPFKHLQRYIHTHVVTQYGLPDGSTGPCCYPTELSPIMMVYLNENKEVLVSNVPSMVATRCGCA